MVCLAVNSAGAQSIADAAKQERARQARLNSPHVFTDADAHTVAPLAGLSAPASSSKPVIANIEVPPPAEDPIKKLRLKVRDLEDQETALKLQINDVTNQVNAVVTDMTTRTAAQTKLGELQTKLAGVQKELAQIRTNLQQMEAQAAPKK